ncbi:MULTISPECIES: SDR family NAD(P)-dependent oxidoreductase [unclassified Pseudofrankia]|uniref:SDR family NAD(P)-dependent oxidoreductase n=1 Tax=unclassified Pseudofrankia TaxID=2994372 RepID=UPI0009F5D5D3|nr:MULTISPECIES: SDR family oxidoreductase [unclassified Pseudofrankia]MDT3443254.1 SDR family oxidoreductase [Pseudofrankia sp. BMG5.37]
MTVLEESGNAAEPGRGRVAGKVAIVTGAGQVPGPGVGTGKATALLLARHGAAVVLVDITPDRAEVTRKEIEQVGGRAVVVAGDVTVAADGERFTQAALDTFGRLDILVNNVGVSRPGSVLDTAEDTWDDLLRINLKSVYQVSRFAIPAMAATGGGSIVNISSIGALRAIGFAAYSAAKGGMISLSQEMAAAHGPLGIRVNVVVPGSVQTPRTQGAAEKLGQDLGEIQKTAASVLPLGAVTHGTGWDVAYAALFFASDESSWISGQVLATDGGASVTLPAVALAGLRRGSGQ